MRYLSPFIRKDLQKKMVLLSGPRQCGKSTLAKGLLDLKGIYLNWDIRGDQKIIRNMAWPKDSSLIVLDELHKFLKWKNFLKGVADEFQNDPPVLVTGSVKLDTFKNQGDALTGRYFHYRLHPIDVAEAKVFLPNESATSRLEHLLRCGGFPEGFLNPEDSERLRNDRFDLVIQEDLRDLSKTNSLRGIKLLVELLRERAGQQISYSNLAEDLSVSAPTAKQWIELLERLYVIFLVTPFSKAIARSIKKEPKVYFYDCAAGYAGDNNGAKLENAVACSLLKYCQFKRDTTGRDYKLHYFRDREKREVDFVVVVDRKIQWCIEVKTADDHLSPSLEYLHLRLKPEDSLQLVMNLNRDKEIRNIKIISAAQWLDQLLI